MSKLKEEELLDTLDTMLIHTITDIDEHEGEYDDYGKKLIKKVRQAYQQIKELIKKPEVTDEWIEEKAIKLNNEILLGSWRKDYYIMCKDFIRSLVEEIIKKEEK